MTGDSLLLATVISAVVTIVYLVLGHSAEQASLQESWSKLQGSARPVASGASEQAPEAPAAKTPLRLMTWNVAN